MACSNKVEGMKHLPVKVPDELAGPVGAAGGIGQPLALLLKMQPYVSELALYDIANVVGVAADLSHCNTPVKVELTHSSDLHH